MSDGMYSIKHKFNQRTHLFQAEMKAAEEQKQCEEEEEKRRAAEKRKEERRLEREVRRVTYISWTFSNL